jgi:hypothetical protein
VSNRIQEVAERANVPEDFVRQLVAADALPGEEGEPELAGAVRRVRLLRSWTAAGLSVETIITPGQSGRPVPGIPGCAGDGLARTPGLLL